jgi:hypothetical protein
MGKLPNGHQSQIGRLHLERKHEALQLQHATKTQTGGKDFIRQGPASRLDLAKFD